MEKARFLLFFVLLASSFATLYLLGPAITGMFIGFGQPTGAEWWNVSWTYRVKIDVNSTQYSRTDWPIEQQINFTDLLPSGTFDINSTRVFEYSQSGSLMYEVPSQFDQDGSYDAATNALGTLVFSMNGTTSANANRTFYVYYDTIENGAKGSVTYPTNLTYGWDGQLANVNNSLLKMFIDSNRGENTSGLYQVRDVNENFVLSALSPDRTAEYIEYSNETYNLTFDLINNASFTNGTVRITLEQIGNEIVFGNTSQTTDEASLIKRYYIYNKGGAQSRGTFIKISQRVTNNAGSSIQRNSTLSGALALDLNRTLNSGYIFSQNANKSNPYSWAWTMGDGGELVGIINLEQTGTTNYFISNNSYTTGRVGTELNTTSISSGSYIEQISLIYFAAIGGGDAVTEFLNVKDRFTNPITITQHLPERMYVTIETTTNQTVYNRNETMLITGNISNGDPYNLTEYMNVTIDMGTASTTDDQTIILYDDGAHDDGASQDNIFANFFNISNTANVTIWSINFTTYTNVSEFINYTIHNFNVTDILNLNVTMLNKNPVEGTVAFGNIYVENYRNDTPISGATINCSYNSTEIINKTDFNNGTYSINFTTPSVSYYILYCNATKNGNFGNNSDDFTSETITTNVSIKTQPSDVNITNVALYYNDSFVVDVNITNIANGTAYSSNISFELYAGWTPNSSLEQCGDLIKETFCIRGFNITIPNGTSPGNYYVNATVNWTNPDTTGSYNKTLINISVLSNPKVNISKSNMTSEVGDGIETNIGNFTILSLGNDALQNISFNCYQGEVCNNFTVSFDPVNISTISVSNNYSVSVNVSVPFSYPVGTYNGTVNVSAENDDYDIFLIFVNLPAETNVSIDTTPSNYTSSNITQEISETFSFTSNITNIGNGSAKYINISLTVPSGWTPNSSLEQCGNLTKDTTCIRPFNITIPNGTSPGNYYVNATVNWTNPDNILGTNITSLNVTVASNALINVSEDIVSGTVADANSSIIGNFTIFSIGNDALQNTNFNCYLGDVCNNFTLIFDPTTIPTIAVNNNYSVSVNVYVPLNYPVGTYNGTVNVSSQNDGYDNLTINVTVPSNRSWTMSPTYCESVEEPAIGTVCEVQIRNLGNDEINFTISPEYGNYTRVNVTSFNVNIGLNYTFNVTYNVSNTSYAIYNSTFTVDAVQSNGNPDNMTLDISLLPNLPPIINFSISPNLTDQNGTVEFFINLTDRSDSGIQWANISVTTPGGFTNQSNMTLLNANGNFSQWYLNYSDMGNTSTRGNYNVTFSTMDNLGNIGNQTGNFSIYKKLLVTSTTLSSTYYQGDTGSIYFVIRNETGGGINGTNVTFTIYNPNNSVYYYSHHETDFDGTIIPMPTFTLSSDAIIGTYNVSSNYTFYDDVLNETLNLTQNSTFNVQTRTISVSGLFADVETVVVWYPDNEMRFAMLIYNGEGTPVDPDYINLTVYRPDDLVYFSYGIGDMTRVSTGYYLFDYQMDTGTPVGMFLAVVNASQGEFTTSKLKAFRVAQGGPYDVRLSLFENEVPQADYLDFELVVENMGTVSQDVFVEYNITDLDGVSYFYDSGVLYNYYYGSEAVYTPANSNQSFTRQAYILSNQPLGTYYIIAKVNYAISQPPIFANTTFTVTRAGEPPPTPTPTPPGQDVQYIVEPTSKIGAGILIAGYNNNITLARGLTKIETVVVENTGMTVLNNVSLFLLGIPTDWFEISPQRVPSSNPGNSSIFFIEFNIPDNANPKSYTANLLAISGVVSDQKRLSLTVYSSIGELLEAELEKLELDLIDLKVDVRIAESEGKDVSDILMFIETIESYIQSANNDIRKNDLEGAMKSVSSAISLMRKSRDLLDTLEVPIVEPVISIWVLLFILIFIIIIIFILIYLWRKKKLKPLLRPYMAQIGKLAELVKRREVDKGKLEEEEQKIVRMLKVLEREKNEGLITSNAYNKMKNNLEKKLKEIEKKIK